MGKKQIYESIMRSVSRVVKRELMEMAGTGVDGDARKSDDMWWNYWGRKRFILRYKKEKNNSWNYYYFVKMTDDGLIDLEYYKERYEMSKGVVHETLKHWVWDNLEDAVAESTNIEIGRYAYPMPYVSNAEDAPIILKLHNKYITLADIMAVLAKIHGVDVNDKNEWDRMSDEQKARKVIADITKKDARWSTDSDYDDYPWYWCACGRFGGWFNPRTQSFESTNKSKLPDAVYDIVRNNKDVIRTAMMYRRA